MRAWFAFLGLPMALASCARCGGDPASPPPFSKGGRPEAHVAVLTDEQRRDPVGAIVARLPKHEAACAQIRSLNDEAEARALAEQITSATALPAGLLPADLGSRGTWWRICVGAEQSPAALVALATQWTADGGALEPFLAKPLTGPRFVAKTRDVVDSRAPTQPQALALLEAGLADNAPVATAGAGLFAGTVRNGKVDDVVIVDAKGARVAVPEGPPPRCVSCAVSFQTGKVVARRVLAAGDVATTPGDELLVEETLEPAARVLSVVAFTASAPASAMKSGGALLGSERPGFVVDGRVVAVEADGDVQREIAIVRRELTRRGDKLCAVHAHAEVLDFTDEGMRKLDEGYAAAMSVAEPSGGAQAALALVAALDAAGDFASGSRMCAVYLVRGRDAAFAQHCLGRVRALQAQGAFIEAVNAGGYLAEAAPELRAAVAGPLFQAAESLDADPRLTASETSCDMHPLVADLQARPLEQSLAIAEARAKERVELADVVDAVFVTGARDFGADTPLGAITARWTERLRLSLPARHAAIEALLLPEADPPAPPADPEPAAAKAPDAAPGFGDRP